MGEVDSDGVVGVVRGFDEAVVVDGAGAEEFDGEGIDGAGADDAGVVVVDNDVGGGRGPDGRAVGGGGDGAVVLHGAGVFGVDARSAAFDDGAGIIGDVGGAEGVDADVDRTRAADVAEVVEGEGAGGVNPDGAGGAVDGGFGAVGDLGGAGGDEDGGGVGAGDVALVDEGGGAAAGEREANAAAGVGGVHGDGLGVGGECPKGD